MQDLVDRILSILSDEQGKLFYTNYYLPAWDALIVQLKPLLFMSWVLFFKNDFSLCGKTVICN